MYYDDDETLEGGDDSPITGNDSGDDDDSDDETITSGGSSSTVTSGGSSSASSNDDTVFELIIEADEPTVVPEIGEEGCFNSIVTRLEDSKNSQTLRYQFGKQETAAKDTKDYSFGRF